VQQTTTFTLLTTLAFTLVLEDSMPTPQLKFASLVQMDVNYAQTVHTNRVRSVDSTLSKMFLTFCR